MVVTRQTYGKYLLIHSVLFRASKLVREGEVRYEKWSGVMYTQVTPSWGRRGREKKKKKKLCEKRGKKKPCKAKLNTLLLCSESEERSPLPGKLMNNPQISSWALGSERLVSHTNTNQPVWNIHFKRKWGGPFQRRPKEGREGEFKAQNGAFFLSLSLFS